MSDDDVPSPIDFHDPVQARAWEADTVRRRPARPKFFDAFVTALNGHFRRPASVLELGSGPGHLAERILAGCPVARYAALDFSAAMHNLARARLAPCPGFERVAFLQRDFRLPSWTDDLGQFDAVLTMQAAHEVRNASRVVTLLSQARGVMSPGGLLLYCDHYTEQESRKNRALHLQPDAQVAAVRGAGFSLIHKLLDAAGMALYAAEY